MRLASSSSRSCLRFREVPLPLLPARPDATRSSALPASVPNRQTDYSRMVQQISSPKEPRLGLGERLQEIRHGFERPFWVANITELFERFSYYAAFASLARYLNESLQFPTQEAGTLAGWFGGAVWFLAAFGGAVADRMGFRRALSLAYM